MNELKIVIQEEIFTTNITTNLVLSLFLDYDGTYFPNKQWADFADILNMWTYTLLKHNGENEAKFILYFMDGLYRLDVTKDKEMKVTIQCINFRNEKPLSALLLAISIIAATRHFTTRSGESVRMGQTLP